MIFLKLKIDNFYMFKDSSFDFTYPKKINSSTIEGEYLEDFPKIKYKRLCILMGANASGKTSLGKVMCAINNYLQGRSLNNVSETICNKERTASFEIIYVTPKSKKIHQFRTVFNSDGLVSEEYRYCDLKVSKNLDKTLIELEKVNNVFKYCSKHTHDIEVPGFKSVAKLLGNKIDDDIPETAWNYMYSDFNSTSENFVNTGLESLEKMLKTFDTSISEVLAITENNNAEFKACFAKEKSLKNKLESNDFDFKKLWSRKEFFNDFLSGHQIKANLIKPDLV